MKINFINKLLDLQGMLNTALSKTCFIHVFWFVKITHL